MPQVPLKHDWREGLGSAEILLQADFFLAFHNYWLRGGSLAPSRLTAAAARLGFVLASPPAAHPPPELLLKRHGHGSCAEKSAMPWVCVSDPTFLHLISTCVLSADTEESKAPRTPLGYLQEGNAAPLLAASAHRASCSNFGWAEDLFSKHLLCCKFSHTFQLWELWKHSPSQPELSCPSFWT